jgi:nucleoid-associated protein YgaU
MTTPIQPITGTAPLSATAFPATSRYNGVPIVTLTTAGNRTIPYLQRRILPSPNSFALLQWYTVTQGERLDNITARVLGDPEQYWRICDANGAMRPEDLTDRVGRALRITLPQGIPGVPNA